MECLDKSQSNFGQPYIHFFCLFRSPGWFIGRNWSRTGAASRGSCASFGNDVDFFFCRIWYRIHQKSLEIWDPRLYTFIYSIWHNIYCLYTVIVGNPIVNHPQNHHTWLVHSAVPLGGRTADWRTWPYFVTEESWIPDSILGVPCYFLRFKQDTVPF